MNYPKKTKVFAYITRIVNNQLELLVFKHRDFPEAGIQVPAGTVIEGEELIDALQREVQEETGLTDFSNTQFIGQQEYCSTYHQQIHLRHFFQLSFKGTSEPTFRHIVKSNDEDNGIVFDFEWIPLEQLPILIAEHDYFIDKIILNENTDENA